MDYAVIHQLLYYFLIINSLAEVGDGPDGFSLQQYVLAPCCPDKIDQQTFLDYLDSNCFRVNAQVGQQPSEFLAGGSATNGVDLFEAGEDTFIDELSHPPISLFIFLFTACNDVSQCFDGMTQGSEVYLLEVFQNKLSQHSDPPNSFDMFIVRRVSHNGGDLDQVTFKVLQLLFLELVSGILHHLPAPVEVTHSEVMEQADFVVIIRRQTSDHEGQVEHNQHPDLRSEFM